MPNRSSAYVGALKIPLALVGFLGITFAAYYFIYLTSEREYLTGRNFRLLATMGERIDAAVENDQKVLTNLRSKLAALAQRSEDEREAELNKTAVFIPILRTAKLVRPDRASADGSGSVGMRFVEPGGRSVWTRRDDLPSTAQTKAVTVNLDLDELLKPILDGELQRSIFDAVFVASTDGRVIFFSGDPRLRIAHVDKLTVASKTRETLDFPRVTKASAMVSVEVVGARYTLLMEPCCGRMGPDDSAPAQGWILGGLTAQRTLSAASSALSFPVMTLLLALLLAALLSWPFLKLLFIGESQRVRVHDVVLVGISAFLGIALVTVLAADLFAVRRMEGLLDDQLLHLASAIKSQTHQELTAAYAELKRLESDMIDTDDAKKMMPDLALRPSDFTPYPFFESLAFLDREGQQQGKLAFDSFVTPLINARAREYFTFWQSGQSAAAFLQPLQSATTGAREAVLSKPSSKQKFAVTAMTIPMHSLIDPVIVPGFGFAVVDRDGRVLFHSDPDHNLSENFFVEADGSRRLRALVAARHEEWVDIKYWGDDHRVLVTPIDLAVGDGEQAARIGVFQEPWSLVTFYDKTVARTINVEWLVIVATLVVIYAGIYVAICLAVLYLRPNYRAPWLWPDPTRSRAYLDAMPPLLVLAGAFAVAIAWLGPADLLAVAALLPFAAWILAYHLLTRGAERSGWSRGGVIAVSIAGLLLVAVVGRGILGWRGLLLSAVATAVAWMIATAENRAAKSADASRLPPLAPPVNVTYGFGAGIFLLVIAAMPSAAFFKSAYDIELENFLKYGQLQVALDRREHESRADETLARRINDDQSLKIVRALRADRWRWWGGYDTFFFCTQPTPKSDGTPVSATDDCPPFTGQVPTAATSESRALPAIVEELLPFYSESSVHFRELVHDRAADQSWGWSRAGTHLFLHMPALTRAAFVSITPPLVPPLFSERSSASELLLLGLVAVAVIAVIAWVVRFTMHTVFVIDVLEPLWSESDDRVGEITRPHLFVVSGEQNLSDQQVLSYCRVDFGKAPSDYAGEAQWFVDQMERLAQTRGDVLLTRFERRLQDRAFNERKLTLLEHAIHTLGRTVVIVSAVPPGNFFTTAAASNDPQDAAAAKRWTDLLARFTVVPARRTEPPREPYRPAEAEAWKEWTAGGWRELVWRLNAYVFAHSATFVDEERRDPVIGRFWKAVLPYAWHPDRPALDLAQLLVEVGERAESYYREIWATCTPAERLVLAQLGQEGLVNEKTKRTVRMLMLRGLVRRQPHFTLMNETFRQFVRSVDVRAEVEALEQRSHGPWDFIRWPFIITVTSGLAFFFATQQELGKTLLGVLTAAATIVPTVVKMASTFGERRSST